MTILCLASNGGRLQAEALVEVINIAPATVTTAAGCRTEGCHQCNSRTAHIVSITATSITALHLPL
jgi:hypothetical protein